MPGHTVGESMIKQSIKAVSELTQLIKDHDVIFILMDSRESRWLPTLLGSYYKKVISVTNVYIYDWRISIFGFPKRLF